MIKWNMKKMYNYCKEHNLDIPKEGQKYKNNSTKYIYICPKHGEYQQRWSEHRVGHGCKECQYSSINKKDDSYFINKLNNKFKGSIRINKIYRKDKGVYGSFTCNKHNYTYDRLVNRMLDKRKGNLCPLCSKENKVKSRTGKTALKTPEEYYNECKEKGYDLPIEDYINNSTKINHKCSKGHIYPQKPNSHLQGHRCPYCLNTTFDEYKNIWNNLNLDKPIVETYVDNNHKMKFICKKGHVYKQFPNQHKFYGCSICNESLGEKYIRNYLDKHHIKYESQKRFKNLKDKTYLSYDFYLPEQKVLIEYQGIQHYQAEDYFGGEKQFKTQQKHDKSKKEYAKDNGYKLLELKYTLNTQELVDKYLSRRIKDFD